MTYTNVDLSKIEITGQNLDYLGIIAGTIKDIGLCDKVEKLLPLKEYKGVKVTHGERVSAMILNGLGFMNDRLYMVSDFFNEKPMKKLFGKNIDKESLNDDALGRCLDAIHEYGETKLFANLAFSIGSEQKLIGRTIKNDTTSISVAGEYKDLSVAKKGEYGNEFSFEYGYSKDKRFDLKQMVLGLATTGTSNFPIWFESLSGNSSDKKSFHETKKKIEKFQKEIKCPHNFIMVMDSEFYNHDKLLSYENSKWITRVPETVKEARKALEEHEDLSTWNQLDKNYHYKIATKKHGNITHKWKIIFSKDAHKKELLTFEKRLEKNKKETQKKVKQLMKEDFRCTKDSLKSGTQLCKRLKFFNLKCTTKTKLVRKQTEEVGQKKFKNIKVHKLDISIEDDKPTQEKARNKLGKFIIATNIMDTSVLSEAEILPTYKSLSGTEKGFKFLKDDAFHASSVFLKTPGRVQALMMIMMLCLMIYNIAEHRIRESLKNNNETLPNQSKKQIKNPSFKWIAQMMRGIMVIYCHLDNGTLIKSNVSNLTDVHKKIIRLYGGEAVKIYELD